MNKQGKNDIGWTEYSWNPITGCKRECWYCLTKNTLILTSSYEWKPINKIEKGDNLITLSEKTPRKLELAKVEKIFKRRAECIELKTSSKSLSGSFEHPVLVNSARWQIMKNLKLGWNMSVLSTPVQFIENLDYKKGYIVGLTEGDGTLKYSKWGSGKSRYWRVALMNQKILKRLQNYLLYFGIGLSIKNFSQKNMYKIETRKFETLQKIKKILLKKNSRNFKIGYLAGIFDAEGTFKKSNLRIFNYKDKILKIVVTYSQELNLNFYKEIYQGYCRGVRLKGGIPKIIEFFAMVNPIKKKIIELKSLTREAIISLKTSGIQEVFNLQTSSGTYIANGFVVHNCFAKKIATRFKPKHPLGDDCTQPGKGLHEIRYKGQAFKYGFEPTFHSYRLSEPRRLKKPSKIFVSDMGDLFALWIPDEWILKVIDVAKQCPLHTFQFLTKNPGRYVVFDFPQNCWLGATITGREDDQDSLYGYLFDERYNLRFISFEPLFAKPLPLVKGWQDWIILGAMTGPGSGKFQPKKEWIEDILKQADKCKIPVFMKKNIKQVWRGRLRQEFP